MIDVRSGCGALGARNHRQHEVLAVADAFDERPRDMDQRCDKHRVRGGFMHLLHPADPPEAIEAVEKGLCVIGLTDGCWGRGRASYQAGVACRTSSWRL